MKKLLLSIGLVTGMIVAGNAATTSIQVSPATMTNLLSSFNGSIQVKQVVITAVNSNAVVQLIDTPTNVLTYTNAPYTNTISYVTNLIYAQTDYYGNTYTLTNWQLIDITNHLVAGNTNNYPVRMGVGAVAGASAVFDNVNYYFNRGIWVTNTSSGVAIVTITYTQ